MLTQVPSPLDKILNIQPLSPEGVKIFLERMQNVIPKIIKEERRRVVLVAEMRNKVLF